VEQAQLPLIAAKTEASSALRGIGLVKVGGLCFEALWFACVCGTAAAATAAAAASLHTCLLAGQQRSDRHKTNHPNNTQPNTQPNNSCLGGAPASSQCKPPLRAA